MDGLQAILVYLTLGAALFYLLKRFVLPKKWFASKKSNPGGCGQEDCGCH
jgi:hypothetical protein